VSSFLVTEKVYKRFMGNSGGAPDAQAIRAARSNMRYHLKYIGWLLAERNWLAGSRMTYADLAAAAQLSSVDFLGDVPWDEDESARIWYARMKSRPSFRTLLADRIAGITPPDHYGDLDF
jgi:glutathione S-transferase